MKKTIDNKQHRWYTVDVKRKEKPHREQVRNSADERELPNLIQAAERGESHAQYGRTAVGLHGAISWQAVDRTGKT